MENLERGKMGEIKEKEIEWEEGTLKPTLTQFPERRKEFKTPSGIMKKVVYTPADLEGLDYVRDLGFPGKYPFIRGPHAAMFRSQLWIIRQQMGVNRSEETREIEDTLMEEGLDAPLIDLDTCQKMCHSSDEPYVKERTGYAGVVLDTLDDFRRVWGGLDLSKVHLAVNDSSVGFITFPMYAAVVEEQGIPAGKVKMTMQNDSLADFTTSNYNRYPPKHHMRLSVDTMEYMAKTYPKSNILAFVGQFYRQTGATAVQEVAFAMSDAIAYIEELVKRGLNIDDFAQRITYQSGGGIDFFEEIAKHRASRRVWARIMKERFKAKDERSCRLKTYVLTPGQTLTTSQPLNNIPRGTIECLAAVLGGATSIEVTPFTEGITIPTSADVWKVGLRLQQIIAYESGVADVVDPMGGSYYMEYLTNKMDEEIMRYIEKIDEMGGIIGAIKYGFLEKEMNRNNYEEKRLIDEGENVVIGVNMFKEEEEGDGEYEVYAPDPKLIGAQIERIAKIKKERDNIKLDEIMGRLKKAAETDQNVTPIVIEAVKAYATVGEIGSAMEDVFGKFNKALLY